MAFDTEIIEARLALNLISPSEMPKLAWDALEAGLDGPALSRLSVLNSPTWSEVEGLRADAMREMRLSTIGVGEAARRLAKRRAREILGSDADPLQFTKEFYSLWMRSDHAAEIAGVGRLDDDVHGRMLGQSKEEIRNHVIRELKRMAES